MSARAGAPALAVEPSERRPPVAAAGFTLVELLIAITLVGIMMVILFAAFRLAQRSTEAVSGRGEQAEEMRVAQQFLRRQFRQIRAPFIDDPDSGRVLSFSGEAERLVFVAPISRQLGAGGLYRFVLEPEPSQSGRQLILSWVPERSGALDQGEGEEVAEPERVTLVEELRAIELGYFGHVPEEGAEIDRLVANRSETPIEAEWTESWPGDRLELPRLIRLRVRTDAGDWPELVAPIKAKVEAAGSARGPSFGPASGPGFGPIPFGNRLRGTSERQPTRERETAPRRARQRQQR